SYDCACNAGFEFNGTTCVDINECALNAAICGPGTCQNLEGSYDCACNAGFEFNGTSCVDVDECALNAAICGPGSCQNLEGSYDCACNAGFEFNGTTCVDIDECALNAAICGPGTCENIEGTYNCVCNDGFEFNGTSCVDVDECALAELNECSENATCTNTAGGYACGCNIGFAGDGTICAVVIAITEPSQGSLTNDARPVVHGTANPGATVIITINGVEVGAAEADENGLWEFTPTEDIEDGDALIVANDNYSYAQVTITIDTIAPELEVYTPVHEEIYLVSPETIEGSAEALAQIDIVINDEHIGSTTADANGEWFFEFDAELADGEYTLVVTATDAAGNQTEVVVDFIVDSTAELIILQPSQDAVVRTATPTVSGEAEPNAVIEIIIDGVVVGTVVADDNGAWSWRPDEALAEGELTVTARAASPAGNRVDSVTFTIDTSTTGVTIDSHQDGDLINDASPVISGGAAPLATVTIFVDGEERATVTADENGNWSWTPDVDLGEGDHTIRVVADDDGIVTDASIEITIDTLAPPLVVISPVDGQVIAAEGGVVSGSSEAGASIDVFLNGVLIGTTTADANGSWSVALPSNLDPEVDQALRVTATDPAGNSSEVELTFFIERDDELPTQLGRFSGGGCTCSSTSGSQPGAFLLLAALVLITVRRRARKSVKL
nr:Ig-like domain repeat protein [Lujinxingiaceae bacterium]